MADRLQLDEFLPYRLSITSNLVSARIARTYEALFGLTIPEWRLVTVIAEAGAITQAELGERTRMDKVTVSRAAIALTGRGLLARAPNANDRRSHHLSLSREGQALYEAVAPKALAMERELFARFSPDELDTFTAMLRRIDDAAREERA
jgi:DNA-binding MarR family transcriptional regulator